MSDEDGTAKILTPAQAWVDALCQVLGWNYQIRSNAGRAARLGKEVREAGGTVDELIAHYGQVDSGGAWWWYRDDWRGRKGQRPTVTGITETWGHWALPTAIQLPVGDAAQLLAYARGLYNGNH